VPLALVLVGVSGAWIGNLTALAPYQPIFLLATFAFLGAGFWHAYRRPNAACADGSYCARPASSRIAKGVLWIATALVLASLAVNVVVPLFL
jgi:mercuric ion transport protein